VSGSDYPTTDTEEIKQLLRQCLEAQSALNERLDGQAVGINNIGENLNWLVTNTQGIFQMFASPAFMSQMSNMLMGGIGNAGQQGSDPNGPAEGTDH
jgi:hypothetical protein